MADLDPFAPGRLGPVEVRNRFIKAATFEGMAEGGLVTDRLVDFHRAVAAGGVGMTTLAYLAVSPDGRGAPAEIVLRPEVVPGLRRLVDAVHAEGATIGAQLGHAGPSRRARGAGASLHRARSPRWRRGSRSRPPRTIWRGSRGTSPARRCCCATPASTPSSSTSATTTC